MKLVYPDFYPDFSCLAAGCPDSCCKSWQIVIDEKSLRHYQSLPGPFGDRVRANILLDKDGDACFRQDGSGRCAFWNKDDLCDLQLALGEDALCETCRDHPRYFEEYGQTREVTLSLSCPAAARLLLCQEDAIGFLTEQTGEAVDAPNDLDPDLYFALLQSRSLVLSLIQDRSRSISDRLGLVLLFSARLQRMADKGRFSRLSALLARFASANEQERLLLRLRRLRRRDASFFAPWMLLRNMEHLTPDFPALLAQTPRTALTHRAFDRDFALQLEHLAVYFVFRWFCKAVNDGQVLARAAGCVFHLLCIRQLYLASAMDFSQLCSLYSKEVEHSDDNIALLHRALRRGTLRWRDLAALL